MAPVVIDLTETSPTSLSPPRHLAITNGRPPLRLNDSQATTEVEGPPQKRRRVETEWAKRQTAACQQVSPFASLALKGLSSNKHLIDEIAIQVVSRLAKDKFFLKRLDESNDFSIPPNDLWTLHKAREIVSELIIQPKYQKQPPTPTTGVEPVKDDLKNVKASAETRDRPITTTKEAESYSWRDKSPPRRRHRAWKRPSASLASSDLWFSLEERPYQSATDRELIAKGVRVLSGKDHINEPTVYHVDFTAGEVNLIVDTISKYVEYPVTGTFECLAQLCQQYNVPSLVGDAIPHRSGEDIRNFCSDLLAGTANSARNGRILRLEEQATDGRHLANEGKRASRVASLLLAREVDGNRGFGRMRRYENFQNEFRKAHEDGMSLIAEFTNCAGDIATTTWIPDDNVLCGTTAHSDSHNQQYNKPGNLLLCSTSLGQLKAFPDHRIPRPIVEKGENSTEAMRQSQDPWLYSSVVSSDYDKIHGLAYTSSFDKTVKVWKVDKTGKTMTAVATWQFDGNVNFVAAALDGSGRVAAAADVPTHAVRIYTVNTEDIENSPYHSFSCSRTDADGSDKWAYFPATMQWGRGRGTQHLLAVGYSPRSFSGDESDIPEDKTKSGEITLWDAARECRVPVMTATTANFFEVVWHPTLPRFIAATSPSVLKIAPGVRSQVHIFRYQDDAYSEYHNLDCFAADINELTFVPNSLQHAYVTAGCTNGNVYVWDTARGDKPIHILEHGHPLDEYYEDREKEDTGVKFTAWGNTLDRFYTGSSDGVVKVWNVRNRQKPYVRTLLEAPGPVSCGAFSPDLSKLVIGDATGRVFLYSLDKRDEPSAHFTTLPGVDRRLRRPTPYIPHLDPPPPESNTGDLEEDDECDLSIADIARQTYLETKQLIIYPNPVIGAVQGPEYASTGLFRREAHLDEDPAGPLLTTYERQQRESIDSSLGRRSRSFGRIRNPGEPGEHLERRHVGNKTRDLDLAAIEDSELAELLKAGAELSISEVDCGYQYEELPEDERWL